MKSLKFNFYRIKHFLKEMSKRNIIGNYFELSSKYNKKSFFSFRTIKNILKNTEMIWLISYTMAKKDIYNDSMRKKDFAEPNSKAYIKVSNIDEYLKKKSFNPLTALKKIAFNRFAFTTVLVIFLIVSAAFISYGFFAAPNNDFELSEEDTINIDEIIAGMAKDTNAGSEIEGGDGIVEEGMPLSEKEYISPKVSYIEYEVKDGDNVTFIAKKYGISIDAIFSANPNIDSKNLRPGNKLRIPSKEGITYKIARNDNLSKIAEMFQADVKTIQKNNGIEGSKIIAGKEIFIEGGKLSEEARMRILGVEFLNPVRGRITSKFGSRIHPVYKTKIHHNGIDIGRNNGEYVLASQSGQVIFAGEKNGYGNYIVILHKNSITTAYGHLAEILVSSGQKVKRGQQIGVVGDTGIATGPHLHFEVKVRGKFVNPRLYVSY